MISHHIQKTIINALIYSDSLSFSQLKPVGLENNIFMYHLKSLIRDKYIIKLPNGRYTLDTKGLQYADTLSFSQMKPRQQPKLINIFAVKNDQNEWLLAKRKVQPYLGMSMLPSGKQHFGENYLDSAKDDLKKLGIDKNPSFKGQIDSIIKQNNIIITHVFGLIFFVKANKISLSQGSKYQYSFEKVTNDDLKLLPGTIEIINQVESTKNLDLSVSDNL